MYSDLRNAHRHGRVVVGDNVGGQFKGPERLSYSLWLSKDRSKKMYCNCTLHN